MTSTSTVAQLLNELRLNLNRDWPRELTDSESRTLMGLHQLEVYASAPVAAWLEGVFSEVEYAELSKSDIATNLSECVDYITSAICLVNSVDDVLRSGWTASSKLMKSLRNESRGRELARKAFVLFFAAIALRTQTEFLFGGTGGLTLTADDKRIAKVFFDRVCERSGELALPVALNVDSSQFLKSLEANLQSAGWI